MSAVVDAAPAVDPGRGPEREARRALWAALVLILVWGANFSVQKAVFAAITPGGFLFVRYLTMPIVAAAWLTAVHGLHWPRLPRRDLLAIAGMGLVGHLLHVGLVTYGIAWSTPFSSSLILACGPLFTLLILRLQGHGERLENGQRAGVVVACLGVLVFLSDKFAGGQWRAGFGDAVLLVAAFCFSWYTVGVRPLIERHGGVTVMTYGVLLGSLPMVLASLPAGLAVDWWAVSAWVWLGTFHAVIVAAFLGWIVWGWVNAVRGVARTAPLMYLMPPVAGAIGWLVTGERYTPVKIGGAALVLAGVALAQFGSRSPRDPVREAPPPVD